MANYIEKDGFEFKYDEKNKLIYYPYNRKVTSEVKEKFKGFMIQLILV